MSKISINIDDLVGENIITSTQRDAILNWHTMNTKGEGTSRFIQILASFGAIITGLGVMLLVASNWDSMTDMMKTITMMGSTLLIYILAYHFSYRNTSYPKTGASLMLLGSLLYGASIMLLGQVYNLGGTFSQALIIWTIPIIMLAYATRFVTIYILSIVLLYLYIFMEIFDRYDFAGFVIANIFIAIGYLSVTLTRYHASDSYCNFGRVLSWTGGASILGGLFAYTYMNFWRYGGASWYSDKPIDGTMWVLFAIVGLGALAIVIDIIRKKKLDLIGDTSFLLGLVPIGLIFFYTLENIRGYSYDNFGSYNDIDIAILTPTILMNIVYILTIAVMIYLGVKRDNRAIVNISMIYLALYLIGKYIAFAFDSKMDGAFIFIGGGIACITMTILIEKIRKRILLSMN